MPAPPQPARTTKPAKPAKPLICEHCGYPLPDLHPDRRCAECGQPATDSDPAKRIGPLWHQRPGPGAWIDIAVDLLRRPAHFYRTLRIDGSNLAPRLFLLSIACLVGAAWALGEAFGVGRPAWQAWALGMVAAKLVLALSYIEAAGVTFFSKQRQWRVPFKLAERVVCYAAVGWLPAAAGLILLNQAWQSGALANAIRPWLPAAGLFPAASLIPAVFVAVGGLLILGFEAWVYVGVRQVRFANAPPTARVDAPDPPRV